MENDLKKKICHTRAIPPLCHRGALFASALDSDALKRHIEAVEDQDSYNQSNWMVGWVSEMQS